MTQVAAFENRLAKNWRHFSRWAQRRELDAFRVYDRDMPEFPWAIDWYAGEVVASWFPSRRDRERDEAPREQRELIDRVLRPGAVHLKVRAPKAWGLEQYQREARTEQTRVVRENGLQFEVNLADYLDTGLFLDHRDTRARVRSEAKGKRFLNLFAYTGAFSVYAAAGGAAQNTSVDLSGHYCDWAKRNLKLNGLSGTVISADVLGWLETDRGPFDLIVLDPPSFSTSKKMERRFEVQRDHRWLLERVRALLAPGGTLYFSTNFRDFELDARVEGATELTPRSLPEDFRPGIHRAWRFTSL
ncbi:MAG: class I SAM-dependent methyltransferase [Archangiaceae bacterium]|nr:class I SAM-dependent methyltransferase [Archangiaceae bacterium]